ncbi:MAG: choice-of-anchor J domain-containing protein [Prevotella sp.]|nr:choice-of-anchor J domain-containing protein [Prevotella sp.]
MKKILYSIMALAISAFTLQSCEDVPAPYDIPGEGGNTETPEVELVGDGTLENPYNAAAANAVAAALPVDGVTDHDVYIKGKIYSVKEEFGTQFGNASFYITDDGVSGEQFYVFRTLYLGNKKYTSGENIKEGDEVIICGKLTNYMGNTPETVANESYLYSLNGKTAASDDGGGDTPAEGEYINETFATSFGTFTVKTIKGQEWIIDFSTAKASGYVNKQNIESESYLVSPAIDLSNSKEACLSFEYILAYANNAGDNKVLITDNYNEASPASSSWEDITGTFAEYKDWNTFHKYSKAIPAKYIGKKNVRIAFYYNASATGSKTWEVRNVILKEGKPDADDNTGGGGNTGGGDSGGVTDGNSVVLIPADLGLANAADVETLTLSDGTTITFDGGGNQNTPKYYNTGKAIRMYPKNTFTVSSSKKIASIVITCDVYNGTTYNASGDLKAEPGTTQTSDNIVTFSGINNKECKVTNVSTTTGAPSQVRMTKLTVVYAE